MNKNCLVCNKEFYTVPSEIKIGKGKYCSKKCFGESRKGKLSWNKGMGIKHLCSGCNQLVAKWRKFCSWDCFLQHRVIWNKGLLGERNSGWKGGIYPINDALRKSSKSRKWGQEVKQIWNYTCQICGLKGGKLHSNHIKKFSDYPELRFDPLNGITLCKDCHLGLVTGHEEEWESYFNFCWENKNLGENYA